MSASSASWWLSNPLNATSMDMWGLAYESGILHHFLQYFIRLTLTVMFVIPCHRIRILFSLHTRGRFFFVWDDSTIVNVMLPKNFHVSAVVPAARLWIVITHLFCWAPLPASIPFIITQDVLPFRRNTIRAIWTLFTWLSVFRRGIQNLSLAARCGSIRLRHIVSLNANK